MRVDQDYYRVLEVDRESSHERIRKAYRRLVLKYHPDKEKDNPVALEKFHLIRDAWEILGNERLRRRYDEARWIAGLVSKKQPDIISAEWLLLQCRQLDAHIKNLDTHRMEQGRLSAYLQALLSDHHLLLLQDADEEKIIEPLTSIVSGIAFRLRPEYFESIIARLRLLNKNIPAGIVLLARLSRAHHNKEIWRRWMPVIALALAVLLCLLMLWWTGSKQL